MRRNLDRLDRLEADRTQHRVRLDTLEKITDTLKQQDKLLGQEISIVNGKLNDRITEMSEACERDIRRSTEATNAELERQVARLDRLDAIQDQKNAQLRQDFDKLLEAHGALKRRLAVSEEHNKKLQNHIDDLIPRNELLEQRVDSLDRQLRYVIKSLTRPALIPKDLERLSGMMVRPCTKETDQQKKDHRSNQ